MCTINWGNSGYLNTLGLMFLYKILSLPNAAISKCIFVRRYLKYIQPNTTVKKGFIPDICELMLKYNLTFVIKDFFSTNCLPSKNSWKMIVSNAIKHKESILWRQRLQNDSDFCRFKEIHAEIYPSSIWSFAVSTPSLNLAHIVANLLIKPPNKDQFYCIICDNTFCDKTRHILAECLGTETLRNFFFDTLISNNLVSRSDIDNLNDSELLVQLLLGRLLPSIPEDSDFIFKSYAFLYIKECMDFFSSIITN